MFAAGISNVCRECSFFDAAMESGEAMRMSTVFHLASRAMQMRKEEAERQFQWRLEEIKSKIWLSHGARNFLDVYNQRL